MSERVRSWDAVTSPSEGLRLFKQFAAPMKRLVLVSQAGHRMHLEKNRRQLYQEARAFLEGA